MRSISFASRPISDRGLAWWAGNRSMIKCSPCSDSRQTCIATRRKYEPRHKALRNVGTKNRALLAPLKNATENARRWLLDALGAALAPTDHEYDDSARTRTLLALLRAPGSVRFGHDQVMVTLKLNLPPTAHRRLTEALKALDTRMLRFTDGKRSVRFRLAPRTLRRDLAATRHTPRRTEP